MLQHCLHTLIGAGGGAERRGTPGFDFGGVRKRAQERFGGGSARGGGFGGTARQELCRIFNRAGLILNPGSCKSKFAVNLQCEPVSVFSHAKVSNRMFEFTFVLF